MKKFLILALLVSSGLGAIEIAQARGAYSLSRDLNSTTGSNVRRDESAGEYSYDVNQGDYSGHGSYGPTLLPYSDLPPHDDMDRLYWNNLR
jgi:hypothetical protein